MGIRYSCSGLSISERRLEREELNRLHDAMETRNAIGHGLMIPAVNLALSQYFVSVAGSPCQKTGGSGERSGPTAERKSWAVERTADWEMADSFRTNSYGPFAFVWDRIICLEQAP